MRVTSTEIQNNFGRYLKLAELGGEEIFITRNGKDIARIVKCDSESTVSEEVAVYENENGPRVTYEEFLKMTEKSDQRYELIDGEVFLLASPSYAHQAAVSEINGRFYNWFKGKKCRSLTSPFDVTLIKRSGKSVVQPDIVVICDTEKIDKRGKYKGVPALVVEVLSPSSKFHDMVRKMALYTQTGIKEFWTVDTDKKELIIYNFKNKDVSGVSVFKGKDVVKSNVFEGLKISLEEVFA